MAFFLFILRSLSCWSNGKRWQQIEHYDHTISYYKSITCPFRAKDLRYLKALLQVDSHYKCENISVEMLYTIKKMIVEFSNNRAMRANKIDNRKRIQKYNPTSILSIKLTAGNCNERTRKVNAGRKIRKWTRSKLFQLPYDPLLNHIQKRDDKSFPFAEWIYKFVQETVLLSFPYN